MSPTRRIRTMDGCTARKQHDAWAPTAFETSPAGKGTAEPDPATTSPITHRPAHRPGQLSWVLEPGDVASAPVLRRLIMQALQTQASQESDLDGAEVVVGELLNNALTHTPGPAWIALSWEGTYPLLTVTDVGPGFGHRPELLDEHHRLVPRLPEDELSEYGRGLYLVAQLTHDLIVNPHPAGGSVVSVTLKLQRR